MTADTTEKSPQTVVVADDHALVRGATRQILEDIPGTQILAEVENGLEAMAVVRKHQPDLLVLDAAMPYANGIEVFAEARRWSPDTRIVILTGLTSVNLHAEWIDIGADGLLLKSCEPEEIRRCFETVLAGHKFVSKSVAESLKDAADPVSLTAREREIPIADQHWPFECCDCRPALHQHQDCRETSRWANGEARRFIGLQSCLPMRSRKGYSNRTSNCDLPWRAQNGV